MFTNCCHKKALQILWMQNDSLLNELYLLVWLPWTLDNSFYLFFLLVLFSVREEYKRSNPIYSEQQKCHVSQRCYTFKKGKSYVKLSPKNAPTFATIVWSLACSAYFCSFWSYWRAAEPSLLALLEHHLMDELGKVLFQQAPDLPKVLVLVLSSICSSPPLLSCTQLCQMANESSTWLMKAVTVCIIPVYLLLANWTFLKSLGRI